MFAQQTQEARPVEEALDLPLVVARLFVLPVEQSLAGRVPGDAVEEIDQLRDLENLAGREQLRRLVVVAADLLDAFLQTVGLGGLLGFGHGHGQAVDEEYHVRPVAVDGAALHPFVGDVEEVLVGVVEVDEADVTLAVLIGDEDRLLAAHPRKGVSVAFNGGAEQVEPTDDLGGPVAVKDAGVEADELSGQVVAEEQPAVAAAPGQGVGGRDVLPADLAGVLEHGILHFGAFAHGSFSREFYGVVME